MNKEQPQTEADHEVRVHIDQELYVSPNPTTGTALYALGKVAGHHELLRELEGDREDALIPNDEAVVHLKQDEHFHSQKEFTVVVNAREKTVAKNALSFNEVVALAFDNPPSGPTTMFTITYRKGPRANREGTLVEGGVVRIKNGMVFNVTATNKS